VEDGEQDILIDFRETIGQPPSHQLDTRIAPAAQAWRDCRRQALGKAGEQVLREEEEISWACVPVVIPSLHVADVAVSGVELNIGGKRCQFAHTESGLAR